MALTLLSPAMGHPFERGKQDRTEIPDGTSPLMLGNPPPICWFVGDAKWQTLAPVHTRTRVLPWLHPWFLDLLLPDIVLFRNPHVHVLDVDRLDIMSRFGVSLPRESFLLVHGFQVWIAILAFMQRPERVVERCSIVLAWGGLPSACPLVIDIHAWIGRDRTTTDPRLPGCGTSPMRLLPSILHPPRCTSWVRWCW